MPSFHAKLGRDRKRKRLKKFCSGYRFSQPKLEHSKKIAKKFKKLKNIILALFLNKPGQDKPRKRPKKKKKMFQVPFQPHLF